MDILVYIIPYIKKKINHHIQWLEHILIILKENDLYVHVEETFLASNKVDYLDHTLSPKGCQPQISKLIPILQQAESNTRKELRSCLEVVNYY